MRALAPRCALLGAVVLLSTASVAGAAEDLKALLKVAQDSGASVGDREKAISDARLFAEANKPKADALKQAIPQLLKDLEQKKTDANYARLIEFTFRAMDPFEPFPEVGPIAKGYLSKDTDSKVRLAALSAIKQHGGTGVTKEMIAIFDEPSSRRDRMREYVENRALTAALALPGADAEKVIEAILKKSKSRGIKLLAVQALGELVAHKPAGELDDAFARSLLLESASATNPDADFACEAALALVRWGTWDGIAEVMKRCQADKKGGSRLCYRTLCVAANKMPAGFAEIPPEKFYEVPQDQRQEAVAAYNAWWERVKGTRPDQTLFEQLAAAGVQVPKDTSIGSKEAISALINGLEVPNRTLRYACLDMLVRRTGRVDLAADFKKLVSSGGTNVSITQDEPTEGYPDGDARATKLYDEQKERAKKWRSWWDKDSGRVVLVGNVWKVP